VVLVGFCAARAAAGGPFLPVGAVVAVAGLRADVLRLAALTAGLRPGVLPGTLGLVLFWVVAAVRASAVAPVAVVSGCGEVGRGLVRLPLDVPGFGSLVFHGPDGLGHGGRLATPPAGPAPLAGASL